MKTRSLIESALKNIKKRAKFGDSATGASHVGEETGLPVQGTAIRH
jgi:hypothetical protein